MSRPSTPGLNIHIPALTAIWVPWHFSFCSGRALDWTHRSLFPKGEPRQINDTRAGKNTHTRLTALFPGQPGWARNRKGKTNLDFTEARDSEWHWHQLGHMQVCTSLQTDDHASTHHSVFYRPDALPAAQPTALKHWRHVQEENKM